MGTTQKQGHLENRGKIVVLFCCGRTEQSPVFSDFPCFSLSSPVFHAIRSSPFFVFPNRTCEIHGELKVEDFSGPNEREQKFMGPNWFYSYVTFQKYSVMYM